MATCDAALFAGDPFESDVQFTMSVAFSDHLRKAQTTLVNSALVPVVEPHLQSLGSPCYYFRMLGNPCIGIAHGVLNFHTLSLALARWLCLSVKLKIAVKLLTVRRWVTELETLSRSENEAGR
jgi:hypothetical protein